jgi:hypothetical protein
MNKILARYAGIPAARWHRISRGDGRGVWMYPDELEDVYTELVGPSRVIKPGADLSTLPTVAEWAAQFMAPSPAEERERIEREWVRRREDWWLAVRALPGGNDPLWRYSSHGDDAPDDVARDLDYRLGDDSRPDRGYWFPRLRLRLTYGTSSLLKYAESMGLPYPTR